MLATLPVSCSAQRRAIFGSTVLVLQQHELPTTACHPHRRRRGALPRPHGQARGLLALGPGAHSRAPVGAADPEGWPSPGSCATALRHRCRGWWFTDPGAQGRRQVVGEDPAPGRGVAGRAQAGEERVPLPCAGRGSGPGGSACAGSRLWSGPGSASRGHRLSAAPRARAGRAAQPRLPL